MTDELTPEQARDRTIMEWQKAKTELDATKEREATLRRELVAMTFPVQTVGTQRHELGRGWSLRFVGKVTYQFADNDAVEVALKEISGMGNEGSFIADRLIKWTPSLSVSELNDLKARAENKDVFAQRILNVLAKVMTTKPASPTLELVEPKKG